ncbi:hypothetical protein V6N11_033502 [Hibiscus sabdariffa]|uniref:Uncharacterized protein n=1 Tax=Hibiscus sabdariffa TaxID=183260 RepID=A0ABR2PYB2_9ROSI
MEWGTAERFRLRGDGRVIGKVEGGWFVARLRAVGGFSVHGWALRVSGDGRLKVVFRGSVGSNVVNGLVEGPRSARVSR